MRATSPNGRRAGLLLVLLGLFCGLTSAAVGPQADAKGAASTVVRTRIEGPLDVGTLSQIRRAVARAEAADQGCVVLELDTPGGSVDLMWKLAQSIDRAREADVPFFAWVNDQAISAGALLALSCDKIYMSGDGKIGDAAPITVGPAGVQALPRGSEEREKMLSFLRAEFRSRAERNQRSGVLAESMVDIDVVVYRVKDGVEERLIDQGEWDDLRMRGEPPELIETVVDSDELLTLTASEALPLGFADGQAEQIEELLARTGYRDARLLESPRTRSDDLLAFLNRISGVLLAMGLFFGYAELKAPGFGLPGALALGCFVLLLIGRYMVGLADIPEIVAVGLGCALIAVEIFVMPGTLWAGIVGGVLILGGLLLAQLGPGFGLSNELERTMLINAALQLMWTAFGALTAMVVLSRWLPDAPLLRHFVVQSSDEKPAFAGAMPEAGGEHAAVAAPGSEGSALTALRPVGKVSLDSRPDLEYEARSEGPAIERGARVRVVEVRSGRLIVAESPSEVTPC